MKDMPIRKKLVISHLLVLLSAFIIGGFGIFGFLQMRNSERSLVQGPLNSIYYAGELYQVCMAEQVAFYELIVNKYDDVEGYFQSIAEAEFQYDRLYQEYRAEASIAGDQNVLKKIETLGEIYYNEYAENKALVGQGIRNADASMVYTAAKQIREKLDAMDSILMELKSSAFQVAQQTQDSDILMSRILIALMIGTVVLSAAVAVVMINLITRLVAKPVRDLAEAADKLSRGDIGVAVQSGGRDEPGLLAEAFQRMVEGVHEQAAWLAKLTKGDYDLKVSARSDRDLINQALQRMVDNTSRMLLDIAAASEEIDSVSQQVAYASQNRAKGAIDQASDIEQLSTSIRHMKNVVEESATVAEQASTEVAEAKQQMAESVLHIEQLSETIATINEGSKNINKIIKTIDDIAFQTNILSLNAAVEAARAGRHGSGFAVVADEVRNLALNSANAAKETSQLIEVSTRLAQEGAVIMQKVNASLGRVGELAAINAATVARISESTHVQAEEIGLISDGVQSISQVVQTNSAAAQQTAVSSQQMSAQASELKSIAGRFRMRGRLTDPTVDSRRVSGYEQAVTIEPIDYDGTEGGRYSVTHQTAQLS